MRFILAVAMLLAAGAAQARETIPAAACRPLTKNVITTGFGGGLFLKGTGVGYIACPIRQPVSSYRTFYQDGDGVGGSNYASVEMKFNTLFIWSTPLGHQPPTAASCNVDPATYHASVPPYYSRFDTKCVVNYPFTGGEFGYFVVTLVQRVKVSQPVKGTGFFGIKTADANETLELTSP